MKTDDTLSTQSKCLNYLYYYLTNDGFKIKKCDLLGIEHISFCDANVFIFRSNIYLCINGLLTFLFINSFERIWIVTFISIHSFVWITQKYKKQKYTNTPVWKCKYTYLRNILSLGNKMKESNIDHSAISFFVIWRVWRHWHEVKIFWRKKC